MIIEVEVKSVYGNTLIYPSNDAAKALARIAGKKTLSVSDLHNASALGLEVVEIKKNYAPIAQMIADDPKYWDEEADSGDRLVSMPSFNSTEYRLRAAGG